MSDLKAYLEANANRVAAQKAERARDALLSTPLFGDEAPPHNGTTTSRAAADGARGHAHADRVRILAYLVAQGDHGATREEIEAALTMNGNTVRPRVAELLREERIWHRFGQEEPLLTEPGNTRPTRSGDPASVLVATLAGICADVEVRRAA